MFKNKLKLLLSATVVCSLFISACGSSQTTDTTTTPAPTEEVTAPTKEADYKQEENMSKLTINVSTEGLGQDSQISDTLFGIFLEDINFAVDGGMYAELIKNRSFEYGTRAANGNKHGWSTTTQSGLSFTIKNTSPLNSSNENYAVLTNTNDTYAGIYNKGYLDGIAITLGTPLNFSAYIKADLAEGQTNDAAAKYDGNVKITVSDKNQVYAETIIENISADWTKYVAVLTPAADGVASGTVIESDVRVSFEIQKGTVAVDMISLMTTDTYKDTVVKRSIGEMLEGLTPAFMRFPGGCVIEGSDEESMYSWKDSIGNGESFVVNGETTVGDVAIRPQGRSLWNGNSAHPYYTTYGIGFYEYFELCEALDCLPVPVLNAGTSCEIQSPKYIVYGINSDEFKQCIQDALDLVEFCRGDETTKWGAVRIAMGHKEPFELKYVAIGNEQWQTEYFQHYRLFEEAFDKAAKENPELYGDITLIVANGTSSGSRVGWSYVEDEENPRTSLVDEHYYEAPSFFFTHTHRYDNYKRNLVAKVFLGEYAAQSNTMEAALSEAAYMTGLEKNGDVVEMACYAPLFANTTSNQWTPDMIWFSKSQVYGSVNYYVQKLFSNNAGTTLLNSELEITADSEATVQKGKVGLASWSTSVAYDNLKVTDNATGEILYQNDFSDENSLGTDNWQKHNGNWKITDGQLVQTNTGSPADGNTGDAIYVGDVNWTNYTLEVEGTVLSGAEGFLIPVCVQGLDENIFWNLGGWTNTVSCLQIVSGGSKSGQVSGTVKKMSITRNKKYDIKVVVAERKITCYLNNAKVIEYTVPSIEPMYESCVTDDNGDIIIKLVNASSASIPLSTTLDNFNPDLYNTTATVLCMSADSKGLTNTVKEPEKCIPVESTLTVSKNFVYDAPKYSVTVIRIKKK